MILADVNVLLHAFDSSAPHHRGYSAWLAETLSGSEEFALLDTVLSGFVRIATHPKIMRRPATVDIAVEFVNALIASPSSRWLRGSEALWRRFTVLCQSDPRIKANLVPDAYIAAAAISHGARVATADRGFARFEGVRFFDPAR